MFSDMENSDPRVAQAHDVLSRRMEAGLDPEKAVSDYVDSMDRIRNEDNRLTAARLRKRGRGRGGRGFAPSEVTGKAPSGPERKADLFARRMTSAYAGVQKLGDFSLDGAKKVRQWMARSHMPGYEIAENLGAVDTLEESLSPRDRLVLNEYKDFMAAQLRLLSGAAIGQHEFKNLGERIIPGIADNQDDRKQKMRMMRDMVMGVANESYRPSYYKEQLDQSESEQRNPVVRAAKAGANRNSRGARKLSESERDADDMDFIGM